MTASRERLRWRGAIAIVAVAAAAMIVGACANPSNSNDGGGGNGSGTDEQETYEVGDTGPANGIIFYDDEADGTDDIDGARYLEAAPDSTEWDVKWGDEGTEIDGNAQLTGIGDGQAATDAVVAHMESEGITGTAAQRADGLSQGGYEDWFLPSEDELDLMYDNEGDIGGFSALNEYWASSESTGGFSANFAKAQSFGNGSKVKSSKSIEHRVRAIRAF